MVCGMITISENVTIVWVNDPWHNCDKQECQGFSFLHKVICDTSTISANSRVLLVECDIFKSLLNILTYHLAEKHSSENPQNSNKNCTEHKYYPYVL